MTKWCLRSCLVCSSRVISEVIGMVGAIFIEVRSVSRLLKGTCNGILKLSRFWTTGFWTKYLTFMGGCFLELGDEPSFGSSVLESGVDLSLHRSCKRTLAILCKDGLFGVSLYHGVLKAVPGEKTVATELEGIMKELNDGRLFLPKRQGPMIIEEIHEDMVHEYHEENTKDNHHFQSLGKYLKPQDNFLAVGNFNEDKKNISNQKNPSSKKTASEHRGPSEASVMNEEICGDIKLTQFQNCLSAEGTMVESTNAVNEEVHEDKAHVQIQESSSMEDSRESSHGLQTNIEFDEKQHKAFEERLRGNEFFKIGDFTAAIDCYNKSLALDQMVAATYTNRALCYMKLKDPANAIDDCTQAIKVEPKSSKAYFRRATSRREMKDFDGALEDFKMFLNLCPDDTSVHSLMEELERQRHRQPRETRCKEQVIVPSDASPNLVMSKTTVSDILENPEKWRTVNAPAIPKTAVEFERSCLNLLKQPSVLREYILAIKTSLYPNIFKEDLTARILKLIVLFMKENDLLFQCKDMLDILEGFTKVNRFQIVVMLLDKQGKEALQQLFGYLITARVDSNMDTHSLKCKYLFS